MNRRHPLALIAALLIVLAGCTDDPQPPVDGTPTTSATSSASAPLSPSPSASSTLPADEQQAFNDATDAVMAFRQTWVDLYTGARTNLNDLHTVLAEGDLLDASLKKVQQDLNAGASASPKGAQVTLVSSEPVSVKLKKEPPTVVLVACIDATVVITHPGDGTSRPGVREEATYTVVKTTYLPSPGWAVQKMEGPADPEKRRC